MLTDKEKRYLAKIVEDDMALPIKNLCVRIEEEFYRGSSVGLEDDHAKIVINVIEKVLEDYIEEIYG